MVSFSTDEEQINSIEFFSTFLEKNNHKIGKKIEGAIGFTLTLPNETQPTKIVICSISNLEQEYLGIKDVNCYIIFVDLENEESKTQIKSILEYAEKHCEISKKIYVLGIYTQEKNDKKLRKVKKKDIINPLDDIDNLDYEYKELNLTNSNEMTEVVMEILQNCSKELTSEQEYNDKEEKKSKSCCIY